MIFISHDLDQVCRLCERGIWLDHGRLKMDGPIDEVAHAYSEAEQEGRDGRRRSSSGRPTRAARPFFTRGVSLSTWEERGILDREVALYRDGRARAAVTS